VYWAFPSNDSADGTPDTILAYDYLLEKWTPIKQDVQVLMAAATGGKTIDDAIFSAGGAYDDLDATPFPSLDSAIWKAGEFQLAAFDASNRLAVFSGTPLTAVVETQEGNLVQGKQAIVRAVRPLVDAGEASSTVGTRDRLTDTVTWGTASTMDATGKCDHRSHARYHRLRLEVSGGFGRIQGAEVDFVPAGNR
jgi:hypothetical protein